MKPKRKITDFLPHNSHITDKCPILGFDLLHLGTETIAKKWVRVYFTSTPHNFLFKSLAAFPFNHRGNKGQRWKRNESCRNDYHQSSRRNWPSQGSHPRSPILKPCSLTTELPGLGLTILWMLEYGPRSWDDSGFFVCTNSSSLIDSARFECPNELIKYSRAQEVSGLSVAATAPVTSHLRHVAVPRYAFLSVVVGPIINGDKDRL